MPPVARRYWASKGIQWDARRAAKQHALAIARELRENTQQATTCAARYKSNSAYGVVTVGTTHYWRARLLLVGASARTCRRSCTVKALL